MIVYKLVGSDLYGRLSAADGADFPLLVDAPIVRPFNGGYMDNVCELTQIS